jgi:hypothetical protein
MNNTASGWYIWIDATCIAGPFVTETEALQSLEPQEREKWTWELGGWQGREMFLNMPIEEFSLAYHVSCDRLYP